MPDLESSQALPPQGDDVPSATAALELAGLTKRYGDNEVVKGVNLAIQEGEMITLLGPSGSGKTTVLKMVAGFTDISAGQIYLRGRDVSKVSPAERGIGMVFQNYALFPHMTVADNIAYGLKMQKRPAQERSQRVREMLELVGLPGMEERMPRQLSGGQQQRIAVARALAFRPTLLLMDEPLGALDRELRERMLVELRRIHREIGVTALYVTHDREEALTLSDRVAIMREGVLEGVGTPRELLRESPTRFIASFFGGHAYLPVRVVGEASGGDARTIEVDCMGQNVRVSVRPSAAGLRPGSDAALVLPANALSGTPEAATRSIQIEASVIESMDLGDRTRVTCLVECGETGVPVRVSGDRLRTVNDVSPSARLRLYIDADLVSVVA